MEDIEMNNNIINENENIKGDDAFIALNNIQQKLNIINNEFNNSLIYIKNYSPFIEKGAEQNMENEQHNFKALENYEENRKNFDQNLESFGEQMNNHFEELLEMTKNLKNYEELNMSENQLKKKLNELKEKNKSTNEEMNKNLNNVKKLFNELNGENLMKNEINIRDDLEPNFDL